VVDVRTCRYVLVVMTTAGLYEIGLPGKSGIGGGIVTVSPGKGALGTFAPKTASRDGRRRIPVPSTGP
jgi:glutaminase